MPPRLHAAVRHRELLRVTHVVALIFSIQLRSSITGVSASDLQTPENVPFIGSHSDKPYHRPRSAEANF